MRKGVGIKNITKQQQTTLQSESESLLTLPGFSIIRETCVYEICCVFFVLQRRGKKERLVREYCVYSCFNVSDNRI